MNRRRQTGLKPEAEEAAASLSIPSACDFFTSSTQAKGRPGSRTVYPGLSGKLQKSPWQANRPRKVAGPEAVIETSDFLDKRSCLPVLMLQDSWASVTAPTGTPLQQPKKACPLAGEK